MTTTLDSHQLSPKLKHPAQGRVLHRLVGLGFAAAALGNATGTVRQAPLFLQWLADGAWTPRTHGSLSIWPTGLMRSSMPRSS